MKTKELEERIIKLENAIKNGLKSTVSDTTIQEPKKEKVKRTPSAYNLFMKEELSRLKKEQGAEFDRKEAFKTIAKSWNEKKSVKNDKTDGWFD